MSSNPEETLSLDEKKDMIATLILQDPSPYIDGYTTALVVGGLVKAQVVQNFFKVFRKSLQNLGLKRFANLLNENEFTIENNNWENRLTEPLIVVCKQII